MTKLSPWNAARRVACPGSRALEELFPQDASNQAREGKLAHKVAADMLWQSDTLGGNSPEVTDEMIEGAELYAGFIQDFFEDYSQLHIEEPLNISVIHPECRGTPDVWTYIHSSKSLNIFDYKFGHGFVEVYENWQLIEYAAGILDKLMINGLQDQETTVGLHVIQPRSFHPEGQIRTWRVKASELRPYFNILREAEHAAMSEKAPTRVSSQCGHCAARHACPALQKAAMVACDVSSSSVPHSLNSVQISTELRFLQHFHQALESRISGLESEALALIRKGERLPHFTAVSGRGRERWKDSPENIAMLGDLLGVDLRILKVVTPKQAVSAGIPEKTVKSRSEIPYGELKLVATDSRKTDKLFGV